MIATPSSPGNVVRVSEVAGQPIYQAYIGSSANPGWRDFAVAAEIVRDSNIPAEVSFDVNPTSRETLEALIVDGRLEALVAAGARIHQTGCNGCIGMGQAPAVGRNSLRTTPRNFPGRRVPRKTRSFSVRRKLLPHRRSRVALPIHERLQRPVRNSAIQSGRR